MLCKRPTARIEETIKEMQGTRFIIEEKLDGERTQLHKRGNEYFYSSRYGISISSSCIVDESSRKGKDYTYLYGKHVGIGSLTPYIHEAFDERVEEYTS
jgi:DNA ligase 4